MPRQRTSRSRPHRARPWTDCGPRSAPSRSDPGRSRREDLQRDRPWDRSERHLRDPACRPAFDLRPVVDKEPRRAGRVDPDEEAVARGPDLGVVDVIGVAERLRHFEEHRDDRPVAGEQREFGPIGVGPGVVVAPTAPVDPLIRPVIDPPTPREVDVARRLVRLDHRCDEQLVAEVVGVIDTERRPVVLV